MEDKRIEETVGISKKPYHTPSMMVLGEIDDLVKSASSPGNDGGGSSNAS